jgi:sarcosine oxidase subunit beta
MKSTEVIVIGGGLQGLSTALQLVRRGKTVAVLEKDSSGRHASGVNAGGVRRLNRALPEIPLSLASQKLWHRIESLVDHDCGFRPNGQVSIAEDPGEMRALEKRVRLLESLGYAHEEVIDGKTLRRLLPGVSDHCVGGLYCRGDGFAEPYLTTLAFRKKVRSLGVTIYDRHPVTAIERTRGMWKVRAGLKTLEAPVLVNCAGAWGARIAAMIGDGAPLTPRALSMMVTARVPGFLKPVVGLANRKLSFKQMPNGSVVIGGGHDSKLNMKTERTVIDFTQLTVSAQTVQDVFPRMKRVTIVRCWAGIEGFLPDQIPVIGPSPSAEDAFHAFGFCGHGFQLSPIMGHIMADLVVEGRSALPIEAFRMERFSRNDEIIDS